MKMLVNVMENNRGANRRQISKCIKAVSRNFILAFTVNDILTFETFYLEKADQGH